MKNVYIKFFCVSLFLVIFNVQNILAGNLPLRVDELKSIKNANKKCFDQGVMICGNPKMGFQNKFIGNFFKGNPKKGFMITPPFLSSKFKKLFRSIKNYNELKNLLSNEFSRLELVVADNNFNRVNSFSNPSVEVDIPELLHKCLASEVNKWGCGISKDRSKECCEKRLGSPTIQLTWIDKIDNEIITLLYNPDMGATKLIRNTDDKIKVIYFCNTIERDRF